MKTIFKPTKLSLLIIGIFTVLSTFAPSMAHSAERSLIGIKVFSPIGIVLKRFGDPTFITSGTQLATVSFIPGELTLGQPTDSGVDPAAPQSDVMSPDASGQPDTDQDPFDPLYDHGIRYYYNLPHRGLIYEFVSTSAGRVVEIKVYGYHSTIKTSLGIGLGADYAQIILKYGYPEQTINEQGEDGDVLTLIYTQDQHIAFRLVRNKVAVISVVAPD